MWTVDRHTPGWVCAYSIIIAAPRTPDRISIAYPVSPV
jgi:hypothetical protein